MYLRQPGLTYSACEPLKIKKEQKRKIKQTRDSRYIYQNKQDKVCFQRNVAYGDFKDLNRRATADKILRDKAFNIVKNPKYDGYQRWLASMVYKDFHKTTSGRTIKNEIISNKELVSNKELAKELHELIIRKFKKRKLHSSGAKLSDLENIWFS